MDSLQAGFRKFCQCGFPENAERSAKAYFRGCVSHGAKSLAYQIDFRIRRPSAGNDYSDATHAVCRRVPRRTGALLRPFPSIRFDAGAPVRRLCAPFAVFAAPSAFGVDYRAEIKTLLYEVARRFFSAHAQFVATSGRQKGESLFFRDEGSHGYLISTGIDFFTVFFREPTVVLSEYTAKPEP